MGGNSLFILFFLGMLGLAPLNAAIIQVNGKWSDSKYAPHLSVAEHYDKGCRLFQEKKWDEALQNFLVVTIHFPESPFYSDALFYSGVCYYHEKDGDLANRQLSAYLNLGGSLQHFEKVFEYKYLIAESFAKGSKKHLFGAKSLPKWASGKKVAIELYDEIISSLPSREIAALSLFGKASLLRDGKEYRESIETLMTLVRRFPKHPMATESFLAISDIYLEQSEAESQNPDLIALSKVNLQRFRKSFPGDERISHAERNLSEMKEIFAASLYKLGQFYEKKKKTNSSSLYYREAIKRYPETQAALSSQKRLDILKPSEALR